MKKIITITTFLLSFLSIFAQNPKILSGPMLGYVEHREATIWIEPSPEVASITIKYYQHGKPETSKTEIGYSPMGAYNPMTFRLVNLEMNTQYDYEILIDEEIIPTFSYPLQFKTKEVWEWRKPAPDFSFLLGSCFYINDAPYDRPGKPYGNSPKILETMGNMPSDFMLWLGDNLYYREADYSSQSGMAYRYSYNFRIPEMQRLRATRSNYAIWDDHDYGANDSDFSFELKEQSLDLFKAYWPNKSFGEPNNSGIYTKYKWSDAEFFLMDDRYHRSADDLADSINGKPNPDKTYFGRQQMNWLKNGLASSTSLFKFITIGGQTLNPLFEGETFYHYQYEWQELINFITNNKIEGVVFLTGDRHFSELIKYQPTQRGAYPLYDFTCSSVTAGTYKIKEGTPEFNNPSRVPGSLLMENNFGKIAITGPKGDRKIILETYDALGTKKWSHTIGEKELKVTK
jgi:alkaline phosphatase D